MDGVGGILDLDFIAFQEDLTGGKLFYAKECLYDFSTASTDQTGQTQDLALTHSKGNILKEAGAVKTFHTKDFFTDLDLGLGEQVLDLSADHCGDQICIGDLIHIVSADILGIPEYGDSGSQSVHIFKTVGDKDDGNAFIPELPGDAIQFFGFTLGQRSGGLIHDEDAGIH